MASLFGNRLSADERKALIERLHQAQGGDCFICEKPIDLVLHKDTLDIDHVIPRKTVGRDDASNLALTHPTCIRSKRARNLEVARVLQRFAKLKAALEPENRSPNLGDILKRAGGGNAELTFKEASGQIEFTLSAVGDEAIYCVPVYEDELSDFRYFFARLPIQYLRHDDRINRHAIGGNFRKLVEEFHLRRPQLDVPLAWIRSENGKSAVHVFDGQNKAAAQIMLGAKAMPVRIFIDPDPDILITIKTNAGRMPRYEWVCRPMQRSLGSTPYQDRINRFRQETGRNDEDLAFSERDLVAHFKDESRKMTSYILAAVCDRVTSSPDNKLRAFIDCDAPGTKRPLSHSSIHKTFFSLFIYQDVLNTALNHRADSGENPRELETSQLIHLMNVIAEEIYIGKFDGDIGTDRVESRLQKGETFPRAHLCACRMSREEVIYNWLRCIQQIAKSHFINSGKPIQEEKLFQYQFPDQLWANIRRFVRNLVALPLWVNKDLSETVFDGKQNLRFWETVFETGKTPQGVQVMPKAINLVEMIK